MTNRDIIDTIVTSCARELFALHDTQLTAAAEVHEPHDYVTVIGFYGESMRGALGLGIDRRIVVRMLEQYADVTHFPVGAEDFVGEAANQLLGRVKNRLLRYGVEFGIALPMVLRGIEVQLAKSASEVWPYRFSTSEGAITVWFDARIEAGLVLEHVEGSDDIVAREGELTMF
jgi:CheY-specific phosphatase CheX